MVESEAGPSWTIVTRNVKMSPSRPDAAASSNDTTGSGGNPVAMTSADIASPTDATKVCSPIPSPKVHTVVADPAESLATVAGSAVPCPSPGANVTAAPSTGEPPASVTLTTTGCGNARPTRARWSAPSTNSMAATVSSGVSAVALISTDGPAVTDAVSVMAPATGPSVQAVVADPAESLATVAGSAVPCPSPGANVTAAPSTGEPPASVTLTTTGCGNARPTRARWSAPDVGLTSAGTCATVTDAVSVSPWNEAVTTPAPLPTAVTSPSASISKTFGSLPDQLIVPAYVVPYWSTIDAVNVAVSPRYVNVADDGDTEIDAGAGGSGGSGGVAESPQARKRVAARSKFHLADIAGSEDLVLAQTSLDGALRGFMR